jgi:hypothetical protein
MRNTWGNSDEIGDFWPLLCPSHMLTPEAALGSLWDTRINLVIAVAKVRTTSGAM